MPIRWMGAVGVTPDWQVLAEVNVASNCDYVDFTGLDINSDWFYILQNTIKNPLGSDSNYYLFVNGDTTTTNYYSQRLTGDYTSVSADRYNAPYWSKCESGHTEFTTGFITKAPDGRPVYELIYKRGQTSTIRIYLFVGEKVSSVTNITSLRIAAQVSGAIGAGSKFILARPRS